MFAGNKNSSAGQLNSPYSPIYCMLCSLSQISATEVTYVLYLGHCDLYINRHNQNSWRLCVGFVINVLYYHDSWRNRLKHTVTCLYVFMYHKERSYEQKRVVMLFLNHETSYCVSMHNKFSRKFRFIILICN